jgi:hypothetical protein
MKVAEGTDMNSGFLNILSEFEYLNWWAFYKDFKFRNQSYKKARRLQSNSSTGMKGYWSSATKSGSLNSFILPVGGLEQGNTVSLLASQETTVLGLTGHLKARGPDIGMKIMFGLPVVEQRSTEFCAQMVKFE